MSSQWFTTQINSGATTLYYVLDDNVTGRQPELLSIDISQANTYFTAKYVVDKTIDGTPIIIRSN